MGGTCGVAIVLRCAQRQRHLSVQINICRDIGDIDEAVFNKILMEAIKVFLKGDNFLLSEGKGVAKRYEYKYLQK